MFESELGEMAKKVHSSFCRFQKLFKCMRNSSTLSSVLVTTFTAWIWKDSFANASGIHTAVLRSRCSWSTVSTGFILVGVADTIVVASTIVGTVGHIFSGLANLIATAKGSGRLSLLNITFSIELAHGTTA